MSSSGYQYIDETGIIVPDTSDLQTEVGDEYKTALQDAQMPTDPETPQGALIVAEVLARSNVVANNAAVANQINPNVSGGIFLEVLCRLTGLEPPQATPTIVVGMTATGVLNTPIPAGSLVAPSLDPTAAQFMVAGTTVINGATLINIQAVNPGPVVAPTGAWFIISDVLGWETITNTSGVVTVGTDRLSDAALRTLRNNTLGLQGSSILEAIFAALNDTPGVQSLQFRENIADSTQTIDGISMVAHSVYACVNGGTDLDVATALAGTKTLGANWNGGTTVNVTDPTSGQTFAVKFDRPTVQAIWVRVTYKGNSVSGSASAAIIQAVLDYQAGVLNGLPGFVVGASVSPFEIASAVASEIPGIFITKVEVSIDGTTYVTTTIAIATNGIGQTVAGHILTVSV